MRYVEREARLHRLLSILKTRGSGFDGEVREFTLADGRLKIEPSARSARGLTTSPPALPVPPPSGGPE